MSIVAYCDDILLMSPTTFHLNVILNHCHLYATLWKMEFNQKKSAYISFEPVSFEPFEPGDDKFKEDFIKNNLKKCERAFYSLYGLGCTQSKNDSLSLQAILPIYFQIWT